jgi:hypothetical protein
MFLIKEYILATVCYYTGIISGAVVAVAVLLCRGEISCNGPGIQIERMKEDCKKRKKAKAVVSVVNILQRNYCS